MITARRHRHALHRGAAALALLLGTVALHAGAATVIVNVGGTGNVFSPQTVNIDPGDKVTFVNKGGFHNAVADDGSFRCAQGCDGDGRNGSGNASRANWVASVVFTQPGRVGYFCEVHGTPGTGMFGSIVVRAPAAPPVAAPGLGAWVALLMVAALGLLGSLRLRRSPGNGC